MRDFGNNGDGTITDRGTGLMWQQSAVSGTWEQVLSSCEGLSLAGYTDWRLSNIRELEGIADRTRSHPALDTAFFPQDLSYYDRLFFWSSTPSDASGNVWFVDFSDGERYSSIDLNTALGCGMVETCGEFGRCVRDVWDSTLIPALTLAITSPEEGSILYLPALTVTGTVTSGASVAVNGTAASVEGEIFSAQVSLAEGQNTITAEAVDSYGQTASQSIMVTLSTKGGIQGIVTSSSTGAPLSLAAVSVTDSSVTVHSASTQTDGSYYLTGISSGGFDIAITKDGYGSYNSTETAYAGQTTVINAALNPIMPVISDISITGVTTDSAVVNWTTDQPTTGLIDYGTTTAYGNSEAEAASSTAHSVILPALSPGTTYHFRIAAANSFGISAYSEDGSFTTLQFEAMTIGDYGNVTVMEVKGNYDSRSADGTVNYLPRQEVSKGFLKTHADEYDFMVIFSNFDFVMPEAGAKAFYLEVRNDVSGIGKAVFDDSASYGSSGRLQGMIDMGNISGIATDPVGPGFEETLGTLTHEQMHRWGASVKFRDGGGNISGALIGKDGEHWSYLLDSDASAIYGNDWRDNKDGTFTSAGSEKYYSALDLYLMGIYDKSQVGPMLLIDNAAVDPLKLPETGATITGAAKSVSIEDIITAEGERVPDASSSQKTFRTAFVLITAPGTFTGSELAGIENIRGAWAGRFAQLTGGMGTIMDIAPSITIAVSSPSDGAVITGTDVTVEGAIINTTGNETGVTVNGVVATVYGSSFIASNVPLTEGANTLTITATDTRGNNEAASLTVNAATTGDYISLTSNIGSGIAPLEVVFRIDGTFSVDNSDIQISGPAAAEIVENPAPDEFTVRLPAEGIYAVTVTVSDSGGHIYEDTAEITVMNQVQLDRLLKAKWEGMKGALREQNVEVALAFYHAEAQERYREIFTSLIESLPNIASNMRPIEMIASDNGLAEYRIRKAGNIGDVTYYIYFVRDGSGIWKILQF